MRGFRAGILLVPVLAGGCTLLGGRRGESPAELRAEAERDAAIQAEVQSRLAAEPSIGPGKIRVVVRRGEVELHGAVDGLGALRCAESNAELTPGVTLVIDYLVLSPGPPTVRCVMPRTARS
jgi:osmotically-inducible protein OsmY